MADRTKDWNYLQRGICYEVRQLPRPYLSSTTTYLFLLGAATRGMESTAANTASDLVPEAPASKPLEDASFRMHAPSTETAASQRRRHLLPNMGDACCRIAGGTYCLVWEAHTP